MTLSRAMEDYLKAVHRLAAAGGKVSTSRLAQYLNCSPASVTNMVQKLSDLKLLSYRPYQGVRLTEAGSKVALEVIRHHRLIELYLLEVLGYSWDKVHAEADRLEHVISEEFEQKIDEALGFPTTDPHGDPIPTRDGRIEDKGGHSLWEAGTGQRVTVRRVSDRNPDVLRYCASLGIYPEVGLDVLERAPFNGPIRVLVTDKEHNLSEELARQIFVVPA